MRKRGTYAGAAFAIAASCMLIAAPPLTAAKAQKPGSNITQVTSIVNDDDSGIAPALQIQSDQLGPYVGDVTGVRSYIQTASAGTIWAIDSYYVKSPDRKVYLSFSEPIPGTGPNGGDPVSPPSGYYVARLGSECDNFGNSMFALPAGQTMACPMNAHFDYGGKTYDLHMADRNVNFPETNHINITCVYPTSGTAPCSQWHLWPSVPYTAPDGTTKYRSIANLSYETTVKNQLTYVKQGDFYFSFSIVVTNP